MKRTFLSILLIFSLLATCSCQKEPTVSAELRENYFEFARTYRIDQIPDFEENEPLYAEDLKWYALALSGEKGEAVSATAMQSAAAYFKNADLPKNLATTPLEIGSVGGKPLMELISYSEKDLGESKQITIEMKCHYIYPLEVLEDQEGFEFQFNPLDEYSPNVLAVIRIMQKEKCSYYEAARKLVISTGEKVPERPSSIIRLEFETKDGKTPTAFLSKSTRYWIAEENNYV